MVSRSRMTVSQTSGSLTRAFDAASGGECDPKRFKYGSLTSAEVVGIRGARRRAGATPTSPAQARRRLAGEVVIGPLG